MGRTRLPPAMSEYRMDSTMMSVSLQVDVSEASSAASVYSLFSSI